MSEVLISRVDDKVQEAVLGDCVSEIQVPRQIVTPRAEIVMSESREPSANRFRPAPEVVSPQKSENKPISLGATVIGNREEEASRSFAKSSQSHHLQKSTSKAARIKRMQCG